MSEQESDYLIVAMKLVKASGAKGVASVRFSKWKHVGTRGQKAWKRK